LRVGICANSGVQMEANPPAAAASLKARKRIYRIWNLIICVLGKGAATKRSTDFTFRGSPP
jgi:hypothetical protein